MIIINTLLVLSVITIIFGIAYIAYFIGKDIGYKQGYQAGVKDNHPTF